MSDPARFEDLLRRLAPQVLGALVRRYGNFADSEDATQDAMVAATDQWARDGVPLDPLAWLIRVGSRRMADQFRSDEARRRREALAASLSMRVGAGPEADDTLTVMFMCCHPSLTPTSAIPLTLRAVGGLTTKEIAAAFMVPETTMSQRISRAKSVIRSSGEPFALPGREEMPERLRLVLHVLYLVFNEGYVTTIGSQLHRPDLASEAIRLARLLHGLMPGEPEVGGLVSLMLLTEARRPSRTTPDGALVPLASQDRTGWDGTLIGEGMAILEKSLTHQRAGEYQLQAAIAASHARAPSHDATDWAEIHSLYHLLERLTDNPVVRLNRAVAAAMVSGPEAGLRLLSGLDERLGDHHRLHAVRGHLLEMAGDPDAARGEFERAAHGTRNTREQAFLLEKAAGLADSAGRPG